MNEQPTNYNSGNAHGFRIVKGLEEVAAIIPDTEDRRAKVEKVRAIIIDALRAKEEEASCID